MKKKEKEAKNKWKTQFFENKGMLYCVYDSIVDRKHGLLFQKYRKWKKFVANKKEQIKHNFIWIFSFHYILFAVVFLSVQTVYSDGSYWLFHHKAFSAWNAEKICKLFLIKITISLAFGFNWQSNMHTWGNLKKSTIIFVAYENSSVLFYHHFMSFSHCVPFCVISYNPYIINNLYLIVK